MPKENLITDHESAAKSISNNRTSERRNRNQEKAAHGDRGERGDTGENSVLQKDEAKTEGKPGRRKTQAEAASAAEAEREKPRPPRDNFLRVARFPDNFPASSAARAAFRLALAAPTRGHAKK